MSEENRKKEETMEEPTREMEKETGAETDLPKTPQKLAIIRSTR